MLERKKERAMSILALAMQEVTMGLFSPLRSRVGHQKSITDWKQHTVRADVFYFAITKLSEGGRKSLHASDSRPYPSSIFSTLLLRERKFLLLGSHKEYICNTNLDIGRPAAATCLVDLRNCDIEFLAPCSRKLALRKGCAMCPVFPHIGDWCIKPP